MNHDHIKIGIANEPAKYGDEMLGADAKLYRVVGVHADDPLRCVVVPGAVFDNLVKRGWLRKP